MNENEKTIWHRLADLDQRIIYLIFAILVGFPLIVPINLPLPISDDVRSAYDLMTEMPSGSIMWLGCEIGATNSAEMRPMMVALVRYALEQGHKIIIAGFWTDGCNLAAIWLDSVFTEMGAVEGEDYINLGYRASMSSILEQARTDMIGAFSDRDIAGATLSSMPLMGRVSKASDLDYLVVLNPGSPGTDNYIAGWRATGDIDTIIDCPSSGQITIAGTNLQAGLTQAMIAGLNGSAQFESLIGAPYKGIKGMDAQGTGHFVVIAFLIIGNISYFKLRSLTAKTEKKEV